jgi:RNA polymerase sigma factor (TIGR02999 family)
MAAGSGQRLLRHTACRVRPGPRLSLDAYFLALHRVRGAGERSTVWRRESDLPRDTVPEVAIMSAEPDTTQLLLQARAGNREAFDRLFTHVYDTLREIAHHRLLKHRPGETLDTTALVHEAYLRLVDQQRSGVQDRAHFFAVASRAMRFVVVDYARARTAAKRGGGEPNVPLDAVQVAADERATDLLALTDALEQLAGVSTRLSDIVEYRFFGGLSFEQIAEVTGMSVRTVKRDWVRARAWLYRSMQPVAGSES